VLASNHVSDSLSEHIKDFALRNAPDVGVGLIDAGGLRRFVGHGLEALNGDRDRIVERTAREVSPANLFSDLNQWMLKILLSPNIPGSLLSAPRGNCENATQLAEPAGVSVMSAFRLVRQLSEEGFLEEQGGLRLVRTEELLERWLSANHYRVHEARARWILSGDRNTFHGALRSYVSRLRSNPSGSKRQNARSMPRLCLALFAAAEVLGFKFVHGVQPHLYIEQLDQVALRELGLSLEVGGREPDVFVRIPRNPESVFRAAVDRDGVPVSDILAHAAASRSSAPSSPIDLAAVLPTDGGGITRSFCDRFAQADPGSGRHHWRLGAPHWDVQSPILRLPRAQLQRLLLPSP
jgi:hypothetical protein